MRKDGPLDQGDRSGMVQNRGVLGIFLRVETTRFVFQYWRITLGYSTTELHTQSFIKSIFI